MTTIIITIPDNGESHVLTSEVSVRTVQDAYTEGDPYVLVEGGLVQNDPLLPVYDMDVLDDDEPDDAVALRELIELHERIVANDDARPSLHSYLDRIERQLEQSSCPAEDLALLKERRAKAEGGRQ